MDSETDENCGCGWEDCKQCQREIEQMEEQREEDEINENLDQIDENQLDLDLDGERDDYDEEDPRGSHSIPEPELEKTGS